MLLSLALTAAIGAQVPQSGDPQERYGARWTPEAAVYQSASPSVVRVRLEARLEGLSASFGPIDLGATKDRWVGVSNGTGVIYSEQGLVITNAHVVSTRDEINPEDTRVRVRLSDAAVRAGESDDYSARLLAIDPDMDLALLQIEADRAFARIPFAEENDLLIGEKVIALGAPFGRSLMLSSGVLSALGQEVGVADREGTARRMTGLIQTDAAVNEGFSGGPLLNAYGQLIGLTVSRVEEAEGIAYAIPIEQVNASLRERLLSGVAALALWTGMEVGPALPELWPRVEQVHPRGPAARAGLLPGDRILAVDRKPISLLEHWADELLKHEAGDALELLIDRNRRSFGVTLELADASRRDSLGLVGAELGRGTYRYRDRATGTLESVDCPRVDRVYPGSPADRLGLRTGDLVLMVGVQDDPRYPAGWAKVRTATELVALMRGPTFKLHEDNIWIARGDESFRGVLPIDDPVVLRSTARNQPAAADLDAGSPLRTPQPTSSSGL